MKLEINCMLWDVNEHLYYCTDMKIGNKIKEERLIMLTVQRNEAFSIDLC